MTVQSHMADIAGKKAIRATGAARADVPGSRKINRSDCISVLPDPDAIHIHVPIDAIKSANHVLPNVGWDATDRALCSSRVAKSNALIRLPVNRNAISLSLFPES